MTTEHLLASFSAALLKRDPTRAAGCFAPEGRLFTPDGTDVGGRAAIAGVLAQLTSSNLRLALEPGRTVHAGRVALCTQRLVLSANGSGAEHFERGFMCSLVLHDDGARWWIQLAAPWGTGATSQADDLGEAGVVNLVRVARPGDPR